MISCTGCCGIGQEAKQSLPGHAAASPASYKWQSVAQNPASGCSGLNRCLAPSIASGEAPEAASCRDNRSRAYSTRASTRGSCEIAKASRRRRGEYSAPDSLPIPASGLFRKLRSKDSSAGAESHVGMWTPLVTYPTGTSSSGHRGKSGWKNLPAHLPVQSAHAIHRPTAANRQIRHIEWLRRVVWVLASEGQEIVNRNAELLLRVCAEILLDEVRRETVKAGRHRRVRGEEVARRGSRPSPLRTVGRSLP